MTHFKERRPRWAILDENNGTLVGAAFPLNLGACDAMLFRKKSEAMTWRKLRDLVHVVWGEERAAMPALVVDVNAGGFTALVSIQEGPQGPFSFFFSDLAWAR